VSTQASVAIIVDDAEPQRQMLEEALTFAGFRIAASVDNGLAGVRAARLHRPELIMMDIIMQEFSGKQAALEIHAFLPEAKIVMVTSMSQGGVLDELRAQGFTTLIKPLMGRDHILQAVTMAYGFEGRPA
jgi:two-component system, response regulator RegA